MTTPASGGGTQIGMLQQPGFYPGTSNAAPSQTVGDAPRVDEWAQYFGPPARPIDANPYDGYKQSTYQLPEAYKGYNSYMTSVLFQLIQQEDLWTVNYALPMVHDETRLEIVWDSIEFTNHMLNPVPEEGTPRLVSQQVSEKRDHVVRYGLAFMLEHGFMRTARGQLCYTMNLKQIKNAVLETAYHNVIEAYLRCKLQSQIWTLRYGRTPSEAALQQARAHEVEEFGLIQKNEHGFDLLDTRLKRAMRARHGVDPNMWVLNEGTKIFLTNVRRENFVYFLNGGGADVFKSGLNGENSKAIDTKNDCMIFEAKAVEVPGMQDPVNLLVRNRVIGEWYPMMPHAEIDDTYNSAHRSVMLYDADKDGFTKVSLYEALDNCPRFADSPTGELFFPPNAPPEDLDGDPFVHEATGGYNVPVHLLGDMNDGALADRTVRDFVKSAVACFDHGSQSSLKRALEAGVRLIAQIEDIPASANPAQAAYFTWLAGAYNGSESRDALTQLVDLPNKGGATNGGIDDANFAASDSGAPKFMPCGYSTYAGLTMLARPRCADSYGRLCTVAKDFVEAVQEVHSRLSLVCNGNLFCDAAHQPSYLLIPDGCNTLVANVLTTPQPPICRTVQGTVDAYIGLTPAVAGEGLEAFISNNPRLDAFRRLAFKQDEANVWQAKDNYATRIASADADSPVQANGEDMRLLEAALCAALSHTTAAPIGKSAQAYSATVALFDKSTDSVFHANGTAASPEDISTTRDCAETLVTMLEASGLGASANMKRNAYVLFELILALRFGPKRISTEEVFAVMYGSSYARTQETMIAYMNSVNAALNEDEGSLSDRIVAKMVFYKILPAGVMDLSKMTQLTGQRSGMANVLPLAGSRGIYTFLGNDMQSFGLTVANDGFGMDTATALNGAQRLGSGSSVVSRDVYPARRTYASFDVRNSGVFFNPRYTGAAREEVAFVEEVPHGPSIVGGVRRRLRQETREMGRPAKFPNVGQGFGGSGGGYPFNRGEERWDEGGFGGGASENFRERYARVVSHESDLLSRCAAAAFLSVEVNRHNLRRFIDNDVVFPFSFVLARPYIEFQMSSGILAKAGKETGMTLVGASNFMLGDDPVRKTHFGHYNVNMRAIVMQERNVHIQNDLAFVGYTRGMNCTFVKTREQHNAYAGHGQGTASLYSYIEPYHGAEEALRHNPVQISDPVSNSASGSRGPALASAKWYSRYFGFNSDDQADPNVPHFYNVSRNNVVLYQGHTGLFNAATRSHDTVLPNTGHLGSNIYPGVRRVFDGMLKGLEQITFPNVWGGGGSVNKTMIY